VGREVRLKPDTTDDNTDMAPETRPFSEFALIDLLDAFASNTPVPGGGSAAALAGALGVSLLIMAAGLPKSRTGAPEEAADLAEAAARLRPLSLTSFFPPKGQQTAQLQASSVTCRRAALYLDSRRVDKSEPLVSMPR